ncbi:peroxiredoxin family protein [Halovenus rubra]|uniref:Peroxiredoxin family protein n=2 Tax=Halovenus rubra TaxID=869890 RepID=A0ACC7DWH3_9EURY|nr:redoxin domain-containing protein [Halovenus rubra]
MEFDVVDLPETEHPTAGDEVPVFTRPLVNAEYWDDVSLADLYEDEPVLLVFYPMDGAFPATYIWNELRDRKFDEYDLTVVGLSISTPYEHESFIEDRTLEETGFRLFSDPTNGVAKQYDIAHSLDGMAGISEPRPATFIIDTDGIVQYSWVAKEWPAFPDYDDLESAVATELTA